MTALLHGCEARKPGVFRDMGTGKRRSRVFELRAGAVGGLFLFWSAEVEPDQIRHVSDEDDNVTDQKHQRGDVRAPDVRAERVDGE